MKNLKTTIKLSVLALACLGAGALALQPTAYAQAETEYADCIHMVNGAAVCVKDGFSGIRWKSKVRPAQYRAMVEAAKAENPDAKITIGTLVMPTDKIGEDGELTEADIANGALDLTANINYDELADATEDVVFYTVVDFNAVADEDKQDAYAMELTAHSYIKIDDKYYFDNLGNYDVSRSARQVAWAAELDGDLDEMTTEKADKAAAYYNPNGTRHQITEENKNTGAAGTAFIDLNNGAVGAQEVDVAFTLPENEVIKEVLIDTENVGFAYSEGVLTLKIAEGQSFPTGETYVAICTDKGFYTEHIIGATMVITDTEGLKIFKAKGGYYDSSTKETLWDTGDYWRPEQEQSGYYVLGKDIDATGYVHGSRIAADYEDVTGKEAPGEFNNSTWNGASSYVNKPIGLTGTFNGMGYTIDGMTMGSEREGFFGIVNGGTVKNVAFVDVQATGAYKTVIANYLIGATIENVYVKTDEYVADANGDGVAESMGFPMKNCALVSNYATSNSRLKSCLFEYSAASGSGTSNTPTGILFYAYGNSYKFTFEDVYCVSNNGMGSYSHLLIYLAKITDKEKEKNPDNWGDVYKKIALAENEAGLTADVSGKNKPTGEGNLKISLHNTTTYPRVYWTGVYRYNTLSDMVNNNKTYTNLADTGCWYLDGSNNLVWGQNPNA